jgi:mannose-1-phosphate guanylyltransferase
VAPGVLRAGASSLPQDSEVEGPAWIGRDVRLGTDVRLTGPVVIGDGASIGDGAQLRNTIVFPGTDLAAGAILIGAIAGHSGILKSLRRRG